MSVGGYASMPAVFAARRLRIPIVVVSYDRTPGRASRLAARRAAAWAVAFPGSPLPRAVVTGAPVRQAVLDVDRGGRPGGGPTRPRRPRRPLPRRRDGRFARFRGAQRRDPVLRDDHLDDRDLAVYQIAGERFAPDIVGADRPGGGRGVFHRVVGYEPNMPAVYAAADLLIGRGGASTVHEVAVTGMPAILMPWPGATDDHQRDNVGWLTEVNAAVMVSDHELDRLGAQIDWLRADPVARAALSRRQPVGARSIAVAPWPI